MKHHYPNEEARAFFEGAYARAGNTGERIGQSAMNHTTSV